MNLEEYQEKLKLSTQNNSISEHIYEMMELFNDLANTKILSYYKYEYEYNDFFHQFTIEEKNSQNNISNNYSKKFKIYLKEKKTVYGYLLLSHKIKPSPILNKLLKKIIKYLVKEKELQKKLFETNIPFNIYLIHDNDLELLAQNLKGGLEEIFNTDVTCDKSIEKYLELFKIKETKHIIIFLINNNKIIEDFEDKIKVLNELIIVIGPNDHHLSMYCGKLGIDNYIPINEFKAENIKTIILNKRKNLLNKNRFGNKIIALSGISGGIGTTTIAMNMSDMIASNLPNKNLLYIDLSTTKAISNLFLEKNPLPEKNIVDLINSNEFNIENNLENGLIKVRENFYCISGIQKHIDKEFIEKDAFIEKLLEYISSSSDYFNFIIIDVGVADASNLKSTIYDIVNELWLVTEMTLPHISKLKTFYSLMKRAGLKDKISFLVNRYDSQNAISVNDVTSILNMNSEDKIQFDSFKIPNDYSVLGKCWNYCELASAKYPESLFIKKLNSILEEKDFYKFENQKVKSKSFFSFLFKEDKR
uniref:AAA family ATPase n=1 Tax=Aliarcobacter sp. TaxID=2321116 RepID=UPI0040475956